MVAELGEADCGRFAKSRAGPGDENGFHGHVSVLGVGGGRRGYGRATHPVSGVATAAAPAAATDASCETAPPDMPMAPTISPPERSGTPPANVASTWFVSSRPGAGAPGLQYSQIASLFASNSTAVLAFLSAMSIEPRTAPSIRRKAFRCPPASRTAMFTATLMSVAFAMAAATTACAF